MSRAFVKPGTAARYAKPFRARRVEDQACPAGGLHVLTNDRNAVTTCVCGATWAELDRVLNGRAS